MLRPLLLVATLALFGEARAEPSPAQVAARVQVEDLPTLSARAQTAQGKASARRAFFAGQASLEAAFYDLADRDLSDPAVVAGLLHLLETADQARAVARVARPVPTGNPRLDARLAAARAAAFDAEDADAALQRRLLLGVQAHLTAHPGLTRAALDRLAAPHAAVVARARALPGDAAPEARAEAERAAAQADLEVARLRGLVASLRRAALVPGAPAPDPTDDLARLATPPGDAAAATRLSLMRPFVGPESAEAVTQALLAWTEEGLLAPARADLAAAEAERAAADAAPTLSIEAATEAVAAAEQALAAQEAALAALASGDDDVLVAREREALTLRKEAATLRLAAARIHLDRSRDAEVQAEAEARRTQAAASVAKEEAAEATRLARDASERRAAALLSDLALAKERTAAAWEQTHALETTLQEAEQASTERLADLRARSSSARALGPFAPDRPDPDTINGELRSFVGELRAAYPERQAAWEQARAARSEAGKQQETVRARVAEERETLDAIQPPTLRASVVETLDLWEQTSADELAAQTHREELLRAESDGVLRRLQWTRELRQSNLELVSRAERQSERSYLAQDIAAEMRLMAPRLRVRVLDGWAWVTSVPGKLADLSTLGTVFMGSFWALLVGLGWWFARRYAPTSARRTLDRVAQRRAGLQPSDLAPVQAPLTRAFETFLDLVVGWLIAEPLGGLSAVAGLLISVYLHVAAYRFALALYDLAFARHPSVRPSLRTLKPLVHDRLRRSVRWVLLWAIARNLVLTLLPDVLGLYTLAGLFGLAFWIAGAVLLGWLLDHWAPDLRAGMKRSQTQHPVLARLAVDPPLRVFSAFQSAGILVFAAFNWALSTLPRLFRQGSGLGKLASQVGQLQLGRDGATAEVLPPLGAEAAEALGARLRDPAHGLAAFDVQKAELLEGLEAWWARPARGVMVLTGDRGCGKSRLVAELGASVAELGLPFEVVTLPGRIRTRAALLAWLSAELDLPGTNDTEDALVEALASRPSRVIVVEDLHRAFLRTVDGFEALRALLYVMNASGARHFWLATAHRPAWAYLSSLGGLLDTGVARQVVTLPPIPERALRKGLMAASEAVGLRPDFGGLARPGVFSDDPEVERERAASLFFRVLGDACGGNPAVASTMWLACLRAPADGADPAAVRVVVDPSIDADPARALDLGSSLILHAVLTHDSLGIDEVGAATNLTPARARTAIKSLVALQVLEQGPAGRLHVSIGALVPTVRMLRRKNLLTWTV